jgi:type IV pilus assembly protein PilV
MSMNLNNRNRKVSGFTLIEVMIAILVLAVGLLGLAGMNARILNGQFEAYQRAQAMLLVDDMVSRLRANPEAARAGDYDDQVRGLAPATNPACDETAAAQNPAMDLACWNEALRGVSVTDGAARLGSMIGARGCIERISGSATSDIVLRVSVAWQGLTPTVAPALDCGVDQYGLDDSLRRVVAVDVGLAYLGE